MQRNKRMARTLGCLVASMTLGAALLDWVQPKRLPTGPSGRTELMSTAPAIWKAIQLEPQAPGSDKEVSHFVISRDGRAFPTTRWQNQETAGSEGIVRISLVAASNSNQVTSEQLGKAWELIRALQQECSIASEQVHYDMLAVPEVPEPAPSKPLAGSPRTSRK
jgi:hypothetical protein